MTHSGKTVTIDLTDTALPFIDQQGEMITTVPRISNSEVCRFKAYGTRTRQP